MKGKDIFIVSSLTAILILLAVLVVMTGIIFTFFFAPSFAYHPYLNPIMPSPYVEPGPSATLEPGYDPTQLEPFFPERIGTYSLTRFRYDLPADYPRIYATIRGGIIAYYTNDANETMLAYIFDCKNPDSCISSYANLFHTAEKRTIRDVSITRIEPRESLIYMWKKGSFAYLIQEDHYQNESTFAEFLDALNTRYDSQNDKKLFS